jgi:hypothetical protein
MTNVETRGTHGPSNVWVGNSFLMNAYSFWRSELNKHWRFDGDITCTNESNPRVGYSTTVEAMFDFFIRNNALLKMKRPVTG